MFFLDIPTGYADPPPRYDDLPPTYMSAQ